MLHVQLVLWRMNWRSLAVTSELEEPPSLVPGYSSSASTVYTSQVQHPCCILKLPNAIALEKLLKDNLSKSEYINSSTVQLDFGTVL